MILKRGKVKTLLIFFQFCLKIQVVWNQVVLGYLKISFHELEKYFLN